MASKNRPLNRVLGRLETLDPVNLTNLVQRLARERSLLEAVFDTLRDGILVVDGDGRIHHANQAACELTGLKDTDLADTTLWKFIPGLAASLGGDRSPRGGVAPVVAREIELRYPEPRTVRLYMVPFRDEAADEMRWAVVLTDITGEKVSTTELIESERLNSIFLLAAGVAHEIGNPLNALTIHLQLMERQLARLKGDRRGDAGVVERLKSAVGVCRGEVERLDGIIRNFLEAIRPRPVELRELDLLTVVEDVLRVLGQELRDREIRVEVEAPAVTSTVAGDRDQLKQVLFNVVKNGMEAMEPGGRLHLRAEVRDDDLTLHVADTGKGIRRDDLGRLFQPFHTTKAGGTGLGLMIVQRIMRAHGGRVGIESQEGVGTVVTLQLPLFRRRVRMLQHG